MFFCPPLLKFIDVEKEVEEIIMKSIFEEKNISDFTCKRLGPK